MEDIDLRVTLNELESDLLQLLILLTKKDDELCIVVRAVLRILTALAGLQKCFGLLRQQQNIALDHVLVHRRRDELGKHPGNNRRGLFYSS